MRLRNIPGSREAIASSEYVINESVMRDYRGRWNEVFGSDRPLYLEIGMGKGLFLFRLADLHPDRSYIGIEKFSSVLIRAVQKRELSPEMSNLLFLRMDAEDLTDVFGPGEVGGIYLNFSDPWPKDRHAKRRLTSRGFLARYKQVLAPGGTVEFKTDNVPLFDFTLEEAREAGWEILAVTRDLHHDEAMNAGNIMTEYEERFSAAGNLICKVVMRPGRE